jgi:hypothetical protein
LEKHYCLAVDESGNRNGKVVDATCLNDIHNLLHHAATPEPALATVNVEDIDSASSPQNGQGERPWDTDIEVGPAAIPAEHLTKRVQNNVNLPIKERLEKDDLIT